MRLYNFKFKAASHTPSLHPRRRTLRGSMIRLPHMSALDLTQAVHYQRCITHLPLLAAEGAMTHSTPRLQIMQTFEYNRRQQQSGVSLGQSGPRQCSPASDAKTRHPVIYRLYRMYTLTYPQQACRAPSLLALLVQKYKY